MNKTKIDWADYSWNPVTGCRNGCLYCYARTICKRFSGDVRLNKASECLYEIDEDGRYILDKPFLTREGRVLNYPFGFEPTLHRYRMGMPQKLKQARNILVGSMTDLFADCIPDEWIEEVFKACKKAPQHNYLFLTKNPGRYIKVDSMVRDLSNIWLGATVTNEDDRYKAWYLLTNTSKNTNKFLSIEPLLGEFDLDRYELLLKDYRNKATLGNYLDWIIVGAETGDRKDKVIPKKEWIMAIKEQCRAAGIPIFMKESLRNLIGQDFAQEFPEGLKKLEKVPINTALYKKLYTNCGLCKKESLKSDMTAILTRRKRGESSKQLTYFCDECMDEFTGLVGIKESDESETN